MIKGTAIATDLDGTLFYPKKTIRMITSHNRKFINRFMDDGGHVIIVSSRSTYISQKVSSNLHRQIDTVCCNGSFVICNNQIIKETFFETSYLKAILAYMRNTFDPPMILLTSKDRNLVLTRTNVSKMTNVLYFIWNFLQGVYRDPFVRSDHIFAREVEKGQVYKIMCMIGITKSKMTQAMYINDLLREKFPEAEFSWIGQFIEITPKGCSKSEGLAFYLDYNKISRDNVIVVGDSGNDISMFEAFNKQSYCMAHADKRVQKHAAHIIRRFSDLEKVLYPSEDSKESEKEEKENESSK